MADNKDKPTEPENNPVAEAPKVNPVVATVATVDQGSPAQLEEAKHDPNPEMQAEVDKPVGPGENLYFFPDLQKSVVAKSMAEATKQVQAELDALKNEENK